MIKRWFNDHPNDTVTHWLTGSSEFIKAIKYDKLENILHMRMKAGNYEYDISLEKADEFSKAGSWGSYYNKHIKLFIKRPSLAREIAIGAREGVVEFFGESLGVALTPQFVFFNVAPVLIDIFIHPVYQKAFYISFNVAEIGYEAIQTKSINIYTLPIKLII